MMDISSYFNVIAIEDRVLHVELTGFWSDQVMEQLSPEIQAAFEKAVLSFGGKKFILLADWSGCPVFGPKAEKHLTESMMIFKRHNGLKVVEVVPKTLIRIGLRRAAIQTGEDDFRIVVSTIAEAQEVIERLDQDLNT